MTTGFIWSQLLLFSLPLCLGLAFQQLYNAVDTMVVGRFVGKEALAAVGSTSNVVNMLVGLSAGLSTGATVVISQCYGSRDYRSLRSAVQSTMIITLITSVLLSILGVVLTRPMLRLMNTPADVFPQAEIYLRIYFAGLSGLIMYNMGAGVLRAVGDSKRPLYFLMFSAVIHVGLALLFVLKFSMGVDGVAYATVLSQILSAVLVLLVLTRTEAPYKIDWRGMKYDPAMMKRILYIGMPAAFQQAITSFSNVFAQSYINDYGSTCMAGWSVFNKVDVFAIMPMQSIALGSATFVAQNYGAGKVKRARDGTRASIVLSLAFTVALGIPVLLWRIPLIKIFTTDLEVIAYAERFLLLLLPFYLAFCFNQIHGGAIRGAGDSTRPLIAYLLSFVALRQVWLFVNKLLGGGFITMALAYPAGWVFASVLLFIFYRRSVLFKTQDKEELPPDAFAQGE